jgi:hypothetical protein
MGLSPGIYNNHSSAAIGWGEVVRMITESGGKIRLDPAHPTMLVFTVGKIPLVEKSEVLKEKLERLA